MFGGVVLLFALIPLSSHADEHGLMPTLPEAKGTQCVEPTEVMRRRHHQFILHQRDETVHQGIRTEQYRFTRCIDCHVQPTADGTYPRHTEDDHFCTVCHLYSSVSIDCFQCHADRPAEAYTAKITNQLNALISVQAEAKDSHLPLHLLRPYDD